jgi:hypothetical protein
VRGTRRTHRATRLTSPERKRPTMDTCFIDQTADLPTALCRLPAESARTYQHFLTYLQLGPRRSIHKLALPLALDERHVERRLSSRHRWVARASGSTRSARRMPCGRCCGTLVGETGTEPACADGALDAWQRVAVPFAAPPPHLVPHVPHEPSEDPQRGELAGPDTARLDDNDMESGQEFARNRGLLPCSASTCGYLCARSHDGEMPGQKMQRWSYPLHRHRQIGSMPRCTAAGDDMLLWLPTIALSAKATPAALLCQRHR